MGGPAPLVQGGLQFQDLKADPAFMAAPPVEQVQYLVEDYLPKQDPEFAAAPEAEKLQYVHEAVLPQIGIKVPPSNIQGPNRPMVPQPLQRFGNALAGGVADSLLNNAYMTKGASLGYLDVTQPLQKFRDEQMQAAGGYQRPKWIDDVLHGAQEMGGSIAPILATDGLGAAAITPRITTTAEAAGQALPMAGQLRQIQQFGQNNPLLSQMARGAMELGGYEALKSHPENQLDLGARAQSGLGGAVMGAAFPAALAGGGKVIQGGVRAVQDLFKPSELPVGLMKQAAASMKKQSMEVLEQLTEVLGKLQRGEVDPALVTADDYAALVTQIDDVARAVQAGKPVKKDVVRIARKIEGRAKIKANNEKRPINVQKRQAEQPEGAQPPQAKEEAPKPAETASSETGEKKQSEVKVLKGSVKEMIEQGFEGTGVKSLDEYATVKTKLNKVGKKSDPQIENVPATIGSAKKKLEAYLKEIDNLGLTDKQKVDYTKQIEGILSDKTRVKDPLGKAQQVYKELEWHRTQHENAPLLEGIHPNLRDVLKTDFNLQTGIGMQRDIHPLELKYENIKQYLRSKSEKQNGAILDKAIRRDIQVEGEYIAEAEGHTSTFRGKEFTPISFRLARKGTDAPKVMVNGYNEEGHFVSLYLDDIQRPLQVVGKETEATGSGFIGKIQFAEPGEIGKNVVPGYRGIYPNVYKGPREYQLSDVLTRGVRAKAIKDSVIVEAMNNMEKAFKLIDDPNVSTAVKNMLRELRDAPELGEREIKKMQVFMNDKQFRTAVCNILGLTH